MLGAWVTITRSSCSILRPIRFLRNATVRMPAAGAHGRPPPYVCAGLHVIGSGGGDSGHGSFTVTKMEPGRCPIAVVNEPRSTTNTELIEGRLNEQVRTNRDRSKERYESGDNGDNSDE
jgi:hypothetical protein